MEQVDEPSCSTPKKRPIDIPSIESIEELRTPASEELLRAFRDEKLSKQANGDAKQQQQQQQQHLIRASSLYEAAVSDSRYPLSAVN
jgi:kinesin family protein 11